MRFLPIRTSAFPPPQASLPKFLAAHLPRLRDRDIVVLTSKLVSIHQGRCVPYRSWKQKHELARREADAYLPSRQQPLAFLTIKHHAIVSSAGIDTSNGNGYLILAPKNPPVAARQLRKFLQKQYRCRDLGVIITDSHSVPLRHGTLGIALGFAGIEPLLDYTGQKSVFGARLKTARANVADAIAAAATLLMGEAGQRTPIVIVRDTAPIRFTNRPRQQLFSDPKTDMYAPLLKIFRRRLDKKQKPA